MPNLSSAYSTEHTFPALYLMSSDTILNCPQIWDSLLSSALSLVFKAFQYFRVRGLSNLRIHPVSFWGVF